MGTVERKPIHEGILIVEDNAEERAHLKGILSRHLAGHKLYEADSSKAAVEVIERHSIGVAFLDVWLGNENSLDAIQKLQSIHENLVFIVVSSDGREELLEKSVDVGVYNYVKKPYRDEDIILTTKIALNLRRKKTECQIKSRIVDEYFSKELTGNHPKIVEVRKTIEKLSRFHNITILITGESGTGKEIVARSLYRHCGDSSRPFISVNCGAIAPNLIESELFGHEKGAFTGAYKRKIGTFELASLGDIFLDEITELPLECQVKLLRVLEYREFMRVGGHERIHSDFRLITATNKNLRALVDDGKFREDLYYRIYGYTINLPPLRERKEDIIPLVDTLLKEICLRLTRKPLTCSERLMSYFQSLSWKGNVRALRNVLENMAMTHEGQRELDRVDIPEQHDYMPPSNGTKLGTLLYEESKTKGLFPALEHIEREAINHAIANSYNLSHASRTLGISKSTLSMKMKKFNLGSTH